MSLFQHGCTNKAATGLRLVALSTLLFSLPTQAAETKDVVAQLGATQFTKSDLSDFVRSLDPETRRQALANPQVMGQLVQLQIVRKALLNEALAKRWQQKPDIAKQADAARDAVIVKTYLASVASLPASYPSDQDIKSAYDLNRDKFLVARRYRMEQIFIAVPPTDKNGAAGLQKAKGLVMKARDGHTRFEDLARQNSQHKPSAQKGGDTGWLVESQLLPEVRARVQGMSRGDVSDPIRSSQGWHIIRLMDTQAAAPRPLAEVKPVITASLRQRKEQDQQQQYIVRLLQKTPVTIREPELRAALKASP